MLGYAQNAKIRENGPEKLNIDRRWRPRRGGGPTDNPEDKWLMEPLRGDPTSEGQKLQLPWCRNRHGFKGIGARLLKFTVRYRLGRTRLRARVSKTSYDVAH